MNSRTRFFAVLFSVLASALISGQANSPAKKERELIMMTVSVWNRDGQPVKGLNREAFALMDEKVSRPIEFFDSTDTPVSVGILIDTSGSVRWSRGREIARPKIIQEAVAQLLQLGHPNNEYFLLSFNKAPEFLTDWKIAQDMLSQKIDIEDVRDETAMYDACFAGMEKLRTAHWPRRVLILISDGQENASKRTFKELRDALRNSDVLLYGLGVFPDSDGGSLEIGGQGVLDGLTETTGGRTFVITDKKQMMIAARVLAAELRQQYRIGFRAGQGEPVNKWRRLKITVTPPPNASRELSKLSIRAREGYYSH